MIVTDKKIKIFSDNNQGDDFYVKDILFENKNIILCTVTNEWYANEFEVMIYKKDGQVFSSELLFYYAKNN